MPDQPTAEESARYVLEADTPLSKSMVWRLQRTFYGDQGIEAWTRSNVPQGITTSPNIARAYARVVNGYFNDLSDVDPSQPVYILELGAGSGRFAYRFLKAFSHLAPRHRFVYVMTDATLSVVEFWRDNPRLRAFVDAGLLDFAHFDLVDLGPIHLLSSGTTLQPGGVANPVVMIGNYIFDTIPQDAYTVASGQLFANLVTIRASSPDLDLTAPDSRVRIGLSFRADSVPTDPTVESDPLIRGLLETYAQRLDNTTVVIPRAGMACIRFFRDLANGRALCLIGDFGDTSEEELPDHGPPGFGAGGGLWLAVNFHAIGEYTRGLGGTARHPYDRHIRLNISMLRFGSADLSSEADGAYTTAIDQHGPDNLSIMTRLLAEHLDTLPYDAVLAMLRTTGWDSDYVLRAVPRLIELLPHMEDRLHPEVLRGIRTTWEQYFPLGEQDDLPFGLGALLYTLQHYQEALEFFQISLRDFGEDPRTTVNLALTLYRLGRLAESLEWLDRTLALDPEHELALQMRPDVAAELGSA
jgi:putative S-adenosyl-L-methionine-dependent methyltransferase